MVFATDGKSLSMEGATALVPLVDAVVVGGGEEATAEAARNLHDAIRSAERSVHEVSLIWASAPIDAASTSSITQLVADARRRRLKGATGVLVRMSGRPAPAAVSEIAARLAEPASGD